MHQAPAVTPTDVRRPRAAAALLVLSVVLQLLGQVVLRMPWAGDGPGTGTWVVSHVLLVLAAIGLLAAMALLARVTGPGVLTLLGLTLLTVGQALTLAVLAIDLEVLPASVDVIRTLDAWDFLAVVGAAVLLLELRRRRGAEPGVDLALLALAVPALDGLVLVAAGAVVLGFAALAHSLATGRGHGAYVWPAVATAMAYAVAATVSWQRAALAVVVLAWTLDHLRASRAADS